MAHYKVINHGGAGYVVKHKSGHYLSAFQSNKGRLGGDYNWTEHDDNAAVHDSREQAHDAGRRATAPGTNHPDGYSQHSEEEQPSYGHVSVDHARQIILEKYGE